MPQAARNLHVVETQPDRNAEDALIEQALAILERRMRNGMKIESTREAIRYLRLKLGERDRECFGFISLTQRHAIIDWHMLFEGTVNQCFVMEREVARKALADNAGSVILFHNHPSGDHEPSTDDIAQTGRTERILRPLDIEVLDHIVVSSSGSTSMAETGLMPKPMVALR